MSQRALVLGTRDRVRELIPDAECCEASAGGKPPATSKQLVAVVTSGGGAAEGLRQSASDTRGTVSVCVARKLAHVPADRRAEAVFSPEADALEQLADELMARLVGDYGALALANGHADSAPGAPQGAFCEPFQSGRLSPVEEKGADWLGGSGREPGILAVTITLSGARRVRLLDGA